MANRTSGGDWAEHNDPLRILSILVVTVHVASLLKMTEVVPLPVLGRKGRLLRFQVETLYPESGTRNQQLEVVPALAHLTPTWNS